MRVLKAALQASVGNMLCQCMFPNSPPGVKVRTCLFVIAIAAAIVACDKKHEVAETNSKAYDAAVMDVLENDKRQARRQDEERKVAIQRTQDEYRACVGLSLFADNVPTIPVTSVAKNISEHCSESYDRITDLMAQALSTADDTERAEFRTRRGQDDLRQESVIPAIVAHRNGAPNPERESTTPLPAPKAKAVSRVKGVSS